MWRMVPLSLCLVLALVAPGVTSADPWKDESGHGRDRRERDWHRWDGHYRRDDWRNHYWPRIPQGHMPPPGEYRLWYPDRPAGHQPPPQRR
jgi:hypothetical protein